MAGPFMSAHPHVLIVVCVCGCCCCCYCNYGYHHLCRWHYIVTVWYCSLWKQTYQYYQAMAVILMTSLPYHDYLPGRMFLGFLRIKMVLTLLRPLETRLIFLLIYTQKFNATVLDTSCQIKAGAFNQDHPTIWDWIALKGSLL